MKHHNVIQGTPEWEELRLNYLTASEAPVIMGANKNMKRNELLEAKATQTPKEFSQFVEEVVFEKGHETEAAARVILEEKTGQELFPVTGSNGRFLASYDGMNAFDTFSMEHKQRERALIAAIADGVVPPLLYWQCEHQLLVCDTLKSITIVVSDGTEDNFETVEYFSVPERRAELLLGWEQFEKDLMAFVPKEKKAEAVGSTPESLPVLVVDIAGQLTTEGNLEEFKKKSFEMIEGINKNLVTDQDFADAALTIKMLKDGEQQIELIKEQLLNKTAPLKIIFSALDEIKGRMAPTRLALNKQAEAQKKNRKNAIVQGAIEETNAYIIEVNKEFEERGIQVIGVSTDMYAAVKGKSSFENMQSSVDDEVARFKIECSQRSNRIRASLNILNDKAADYMFLFPNLQELVALEHDHLKLTIDSKINSFKEEEQAKEQKRIGACRDVIERFIGIGEKAPMIDSLEKLQQVRASIAEFDTTEPSPEGFEKEIADAKRDALTAIDRRYRARVQELADAELAAEAAASESQPVSQPQSGSVQHHPVSSAEPIEISDNRIADDDAMPGHEDLGDSAGITELRIQLSEMHGQRLFEGIQDQNGNQLFNIGTFIEGDNGAHELLITAADFA